MAVGDVDPSRPVVVLTGAGVSKESGLDTFRDAGGIWSRVRLEDVATPDAYRRDPARVQAFYNARRRQLVSGTARPNAAHLALAALERAWPGGVTVVTQNIDDLHEAAGTQSLIHMHGKLREARCEGCGAVLAWDEDLTGATACPACGKVGALRPHVVWFGEMPLEMARIGALLASCGLFIAIGTSGNVYPAAGFVAEVRSYGEAHTVELNLEPSETVSHFHETIHGPATEVVPAYVERLLALAGDPVRR
jgi:NAD-dependent deacetylase